MKSCKREEKYVHSSLGGNLNLCPPDWEPSVLLTTEPFQNTFGHAMYKNLTSYNTSNFDIYILLSLTTEDKH